MPALLEGVVRLTNPQVVGEEHHYTTTVISPLDPEVLLAAGVRLIRPGAQVLLNDGALVKISGDFQKVLAEEDAEGAERLVITVADEQMFEHLTEYAGIVGFPKFVIAGAIHHVVEAVGPQPAHLILEVAKYQDALPWFCRCDLGAYHPEVVDRFQRLHQERVKTFSVVHANLTSTNLGTDGETVHFTFHPSCVIECNKFADDDMTFYADHSLNIPLPEDAPDGHPPPASNQTNTDGHPPPASNQTNTSQDILSNSTPAADTPSVASDTAVAQAAHDTTASTSTPLYVEAATQTEHDNALDIDAADANLPTPTVPGGFPRSVHNSPSPSQSASAGMLSEEEVEIILSNDSGDEALDMAAVAALEPGVAIDQDLSVVTSVFDSELSSVSDSTPNSPTTTAGSLSGEDTSFLATGEADLAIAPFTPGKGVITAATTPFTPRTRRNAIVEAFSSPAGALARLLDSSPLLPSVFHGTKRTRSRAAHHDDGYDAEGSESDGVVDNDDDDDDYVDDEEDSGMEEYQGKGKAKARGVRRAIKALKAPASKKARLAY